MKEIERKWFFNTKYDYKKIVGKDKSMIRDFYFNDSTRLRQINNKFYMTVKSFGTLIRDEYEFEIKKPIYSFQPTLEKIRYFVKYEGHRFEINYFKDILVRENGIMTNLILVECELPKEKEKIKLPVWISEEITNNKEFYGYNLFKRLRKGEQ